MTTRPSALLVGLEWSRITKMTPVYNISTYSGTVIVVLLQEQSYIVSEE